MARLCALWVMTALAACAAEGAQGAASDFVSAPGVAPEAHPAPGRLPGQPTVTPLPSGETTDESVARRRAEVDAGNGVTPDYVSAPGVAPEAHPAPGRLPDDHYQQMHNSAQHGTTDESFARLQAELRERQAARAPGVAPGVPNVDEVDAWVSTVTLSPTPLYSQLGKINPLFETEGDSDEGEVFLPNIAVNSSCVLSSSSSSQGTFCRLSDDESQRLATASEENPFILVDLEELYFVDHLSFAVNVDAVSLESKLSVQCLNESHADVTNSDGSHLPASWRKVVQHNSGNYSFHVHSPCQIVRMQRLSFGPLVVANLKIFGAHIKNRDLLNCMTGHDSQLCSGRGECESGRCQCHLGYGGAKCDNFYAAKLFFSAVQAALLVSAFVALTMCFRWSRRVEKGGDGTAYKVLESEPPQDEATRGLEVGSAPPALSRAHSVPCGALGGDGHDGAAGDGPDTKAGSLHLLFASPLVMAVKSKAGDGGECFRPIQALDIRREYGMLRQSLQRASGGAKVQVPLSVSAATVDQLHSIMTLGNARCLHFSGHCTRDFLAFEDAASQLHQIRMPMLRRLLRSTVTPKSFETLRLVVLNACNSENAALEFVLAGVPHVIAYRKKVRDSTAATFTQALYLSLGCGRTIRDAFESAKEAVRSSASADAAESDAFLLLPERGDHAEPLWNATSLAAGVPNWPHSQGMRMLPPLADEFVGRHMDEWQLLDALTHRQRRLIVITGAAGVGKTQLSLAIAHHVHHRRSTKLCRDGVFFVKGVADPDLTDLERLAVLVDALFKAMYPMLTRPTGPDDQGERSTIVDADRIKSAACLADLVDDDVSSADAAAARRFRRTVDRKIALLIEALSAREADCLLVLDAVEESAELAGLLSSLLEVPRLRVLVTCRTPYQVPLDVNLQHYALGPLSPGDAALLLMRHLKRKVLHAGAELCLQALSEQPCVADAAGNPFEIIRSAREMSCRFPTNSPIDLAA